MASNHICFETVVREKDETGRSIRYGMFLGYKSIEILLTYQSKDGYPVSLCQIRTILGDYEVLEIHMEDIVKEISMGNLKYKV